MTAGEYDTINLQNLNVLLNMPVMSKSGAFPLNLSWQAGIPMFGLSGFAVFSLGSFKLFH